MQPRKRYLWFARFNRRTITLFAQPFEKEMAELLDPARIVSYRNRQWRLSQPRWQERVVWGKLGFAKPKGEVVCEDHDYVLREVPPGVQRGFSYFAIDLASRVIAFEERRPEISREGFLWTKRKLVEDARWELDLLTDSESFDTWLESVDRVTRFSAPLLPPNPWTYAEEIRGLVVEPRSKHTNLEARNDLDPEGLAIRDTALGIAAEHADLGNGNYRATGITGRALRFFDSRRRALSRVIQVYDDDAEATIVREIVERLEEIDVPPAPNSENPSDT